MHDFDDNGKLDGHELLAAMTHATDHGPDGALPFDEKECKYRIKSFHASYSGIHIYDNNTFLLNRVLECLSI